MGLLISSFAFGVTAEALRAIIGSTSAISLEWRSVKPKLQVERVASINHSFCQKTTLNVLSYCIQVAHLSQRDCAAGWFSYGQKWKNGTGRQYLRTL